MKGISRDKILDAISGDEEISSSTVVRQFLININALPNIYGTNKIPLTFIRNYINSELCRTDSDASDRYKELLCTAIEKILIEQHEYKGYTYLYWILEGYFKWIEAGRPGFPKKIKFIYGPRMKMFNRFYF